MRALLVDDEEPARERLRRLLTELGGVEVSGEAGDGEQAMENIATLKPDLVFLDIQMPGCTGMEVAASLAAPRPRIIFCTAFDQYAVDAFELNAVDYLLKPVNRARLEKALERVRGEGARAEGKDAVPARDVLYFASENGLTKLQAAGQHYWMQPTLNDLEARLEPKQFFRISRAVIVNLDAVRDVAPLVGGQGEVTLVDGSKLEVSRRRFAELTERLGG
ncbi:MAG: DNA-binding response regulator [Acidobacteria bacterium]|nr:MAG: DNA-binding response regulator [Acidobacteriota bacterium]